MNIIVCVKQVPDPEAPAASFKVDEAAKKVLPVQGVPPVISQFDAIAVEAALRVKDATGDGKVIIVSVGPAGARDVIKHGLAMGADEGVLVTGPGTDDLDSFRTADVLAATIRKIGEYDIVMCGRQATDWDFGVVGSGLAELLGIPAATIAMGVEAANGKLRVKRVLANGFETLEVATPSVVTVSNELGEPRYPQLKQIMAAAKKQVTEWSLADIGVGDLPPRLNLDRLFIPVNEGDVEMMEGETPQEMAANLVRRLREEKVI